MKPAKAQHTDGVTPPARLPAWADGHATDDPAVLAFRCGSALMALDMVLRDPSLPGGVFRDRQALAAAEACLMRTGRRDGVAALRDEVHLLRPTESPGPGGAVFLQWRRAARLRLIRGWQDRLHHDVPGEQETVDHAVKRAGGTDPMALAVEILRTGLRQDPRGAIATLIHADCALSAALGWACPVPLLAAGLTRADLRDPDQLGPACHRAVTKAVVAALRQAADLTRRAARLRSVAPKVRTKGADAAIALFFDEDAISPVRALTPVIRNTRQPMSDRAARRLCDRLVQLGGVRELSGRDSFRIYGL